jgi:Arc/MetJ-type ribon-helix-helix transcriptional regulator
MPRKGKGKVKTSISLDPEIVQWIDKLIEKKRFADRTHAIELALQKLRESGYGEN